MKCNECEKFRAFLDDNYFKFTDQDMVSEYHQDGHKIPSMDSVFRKVIKYPELARLAMNDVLAHEKGDLR